MLRYACRPGLLALQCSTPRRFAHDGISTAWKDFVPEVKRPRCYLDFTLEGFPAGSVVIELFSEIVPRAAENFRCLCTGEKGEGLSYKNTLISTMVFGVYMAGGDVHKGVGSGGESIYGPLMDDENYMVQHEHAGIVGMINCGVPHTNGSQFYITVSPAPFMDGKNVGIGYIIEGLDVVKKIVRVAGVPDVSGGRRMGQGRGARRSVMIESCGELTGPEYDQYSNAKD